MSLLPPVNNTFLQMAEAGDLDLSIQSEISFGVGHYVPYFTLLDQNRAIREIQLYAGRYVVICLLPPDECLIKKILKMRDESRFSLNISSVNIIFIISASTEKVLSLHSKTKSTISFWSDHSGAVFDFLGAEDSSSPRFLLADTNLKVLDVVDGFNGEDVVKELLYKKDKFCVDAKPDITSRHAPVIQIPNVLNSGLCNRVVDYWEKGQQYEGTIGVQSNTAVKPETKIRTDVNVDDKGFLTELDYTLGLSAYPELMKVADFKVTHRERYKIGCYEAEKGGHYRQHRDTFSLSLANRRYSICVALNDDYEGGQLVFSEYSNIGYKLSKGSAIIFPSVLFHRVEPVTKGRRLMMVSFLYDEDGAAFRSHNRITTGVKDDTDNNRLLAAPDDSMLSLSQVYPQAVRRSGPRVFYSKVSPKFTVPEGSVRKFDLADLIQKSLQQELIAKAEQLINYAEMNSACDVSSSQLDKFKENLKQLKQSRSTYLILIAGDSLSLPRPDRLKEFDPEFNPFLATKYFETYPRLLEDLLQKAHSEKKIRVDNSLCQRAFKSTNLTTRMPDIFSYAAPDVVILQVGIVDCWRRGNDLDKQDVPISQYEKEVRKLFSYRKTACPSTPVIVIGICPADLNLFKRNAGMNQVISEYNKVLKSIVEEQCNAVFVDMESMFDIADPYQLLHFDGIHMSNSGHKILSECLFDIIINIKNLYL